MTPSRIAIADIGSNSARMVVMQRSGEFGLVTVSESKFALRLQRRIDESGELTPEAMQRLIRVVKDFDAVAKSAGSDQLVAIATSAIRSSSDPADIVRQVQAATGVNLQVLSGQEEAEATFTGAVSTLPVRDGAVIDLGGGSMEVVRFEDREPTHSVMLPLGALRLSDRFLKGDKVSQKELQRLANHVESKLSGAGVEPLGPRSQVVGTGGTVRNAAKMDRRVSGRRFGRLHGHRIGLDELEQTLKQISEMSRDELRWVPGLNPERADSIVGGIAALVATVNYLDGDSVLASGTGLREGLALQAFGVGIGPASSSSMQSVRDMCSRFATWDSDRASRRALIAARVSAAFNDIVTAEIAEALALAAELVDAGSAIDYYHRYSSAAFLIVDGNAGTLTHRQIALVAAICMAAEKEDVKTRAYGGEITSDETHVLEKAGVLLRLADEIEMRLFGGSDGSGGSEGYAESLEIARSDAGNDDVRISFPGAGDWQPSSLKRYYKSVFAGTIELADDQNV